MGRSLVGRGDSGRGWGGKGVTTAAAGQVRQGRGRTRGGAGLRPGPRLSAPSRLRLRSSRLWSGRRRAGPEGGGGRTEDSLLSRPTCLEPPHPPSPTTRSRAAAARAPEAARRAGAETTAPSLPRALPPLAAPPPPLPQARPRAGALTTAPCRPSPTPPPAPPSPAGLAAATAAARRSSWRDPDVVGQELRRGPAGEGRPQMTPLPCPAFPVSASLRLGPQVEGDGSIRIPDQNQNWDLDPPAPGGWTECMTVRSPENREPLQPGGLPHRDSGARVSTPPAPVLPPVCKYNPQFLQRLRPQGREDRAGPFYFSRA